MKRVELLTVEGASKLGHLLIVRPDFSMPQGWEKHGWTERTESVLVVKPDGQQVDATAQIGMTHLNIRDPDAPIDMRWRLKLFFTNMSQENLPVGSKILVSEEIRDAILGNKSV